MTVLKTMRICAREFSKIGKLWSYIPMPQISRALP